jgi:hypothetical protein
MRLRLLLVALAASVAAFSQATMTVKQVMEFVRSSVQQKLPDKAVADYLHKVKLSERLNDSDIEQLLGDGAGPRAVDALKSLRDASANLAAAAPPPAPVIYKQPPPPGEDKQREIINSAREYALNYTKSLPDFICAQITERFTDPTGKESWRKGDTIKTKLSYNGQKENYEVMLVNDQSVSGKTMESLGGTTSTGEFASMLRYIFEPASETEFHWERWATWNHHVSYVFNYAVDQPHSQWGIVDGESKRSVTSAYKGLLYIERETGQILRVTLESVNIPADFPIQVAKEALTYDYADLSGIKFLLPAKSEVRLDRGRYFSRNDVYFRSYRKFSADAVISFDDPSAPPDKK